MANNSLPCYVISGALVFIRSDEKKFIPQYCQKKGFIGGADMQFGRRRQKMNRNTALKAACFE